MKTTNVLTKTRLRRAAANAHHAYAHALAALCLADSACQELASTLAGLRPDELAAADISTQNVLDTSSVAWSLHNFAGILESDCPVAVSDMLPPERGDASPVAPMNDLRAERGAGESAGCIDTEGVSIDDALAALGE